MKRLLFTGYPGWLGENFVSDFFSRNQKDYTHLRCLIAPWIDEKNLQNIRLKYPKLELFRGDLRDTRSLDVATQEVHGIIHSAGIIHPRKPNDWFEINLEGTKNLYNSAKKNKTARRFVFVSSNAAGGKSADVNQLISEVHPSIPKNGYGLSKRKAELFLLTEGGIPSIVLRPCMFYGTPLPSRHVDFFRRIETGFIPTIGEKLPRSMVHIQNLVDACWLALLSEKGIGKFYYIADRKPYSIGEYIDTIAKNLNANPRKIYLPSFISSFAYAADSFLCKLGVYNQNIHLLGEADWAVGLSIEAAKKDLGYDPQYTLQDGIRQAVEYYKEIKR